jgi:hypothetical protein
MIEDGVTKINGGKIATNTIAANALAITDLQETGAKLSGWVLDADKIRGQYASWETVLRVPKDSGDIVFQAGTIGDPQVKIYTYGRLVARDAEIKGSVSAIAGKIGGWTITEDSIWTTYNASGYLYTTELRKPKSSTDPVFITITAGTPQFELLADGTLKANKAEIKGSVSATAFEVLNGDGDKIGGLYGSGSNAYLAAGRLINPENPDGTSIMVGVPSGVSKDAIMFIDQAMGRTHNYLSFISFEPFGPNAYTEIRGGGSYLTITNGNSTSSPSIALSLLEMVGERRISLDGVVRITDDLLFRSGCSIGSSGTPVGTIYTNYLYASSLLPSGISSTIGNLNTSWYLGNFLFLRTSVFTLGGKTVNVRAADGVLYVNP